MDSKWFRTEFVQHHRHQGRRSHHTGTIHGSVILHDPCRISNLFANVPCFLNPRSIEPLLHAQACRLCVCTPIMRNAASGSHDAGRRSGMKEEGCPADFRLSQTRLQPAQTQGVGRKVPFFPIILIIATGNSLIFRFALNWTPLPSIMIIGIRWWVSIILVSLFLNIHGHGGLSTLESWFLFSVNFTSSTILQKCR